MSFERVGRELYSYFSGNKWLKVLLPLDSAIVYAVAALGVLGVFINLGGLVSALLFYLFFLGVLLAISKSNYQLVAIAFGVEALERVYSLVSSLIRARGLNYSALLGVLVYGFFAYMAYKKSLNLAK